MIPINESKWDLSRYGITKSRNQTQHSLLTALENCGIAIDVIREFVENAITSQIDVDLPEFPIKKLKIISSKLSIRLRVTRYNSKGKVDTVYYPKKTCDLPIIKICCYEGFYFIFDFVEFEGKKLNSFEFIDLLDSHNQLNWKKPKRLVIERPELTLEDYISDQKPFEIRKLTNFKKPPSISYADIECITRPQHFPLIFGRVCNGEFRKISFGYDNSWENFKVFLDSFPPGYNIVYFHNLKYDWNVIKSNPWTNIKTVLKKDGIYYNVILGYKRTILDLRDSFKFIPKALASFSSMFQLEGLNKIDTILYELYTVENTTKDYINWAFWDRIQSYDFVYNSNCEKVSGPDSNIEYLLLDRVLVDSNFLTKVSNYFVGDRYYHLAHYEYYLTQDCKLLHEGMESFRSKMKEVLCLDVHNRLTLPSLVHTRISQIGCYEGVYSLMDHLRKFVSESVHGGRVCSRFNKKWNLKGRFTVIDGRSLYPSSIVRLCNPTKEDYGRQPGLPVGKAEIITDWSQKDSYSHYIVRIRMKKIGKKQQIPMVNYYKDFGRVYTNKVVPGHEIVVVDRITLEDWVNFCKLEYDFIEGIGWLPCDVPNVKLGKFVSDLYDLRRSYVKDGNTSMSEVCKLALNSLYGKTISKPNSTKTIIKDNDEMEEYFDTNFEDIHTAEKCKKQTIVEIDNDDICQSNTAHVGGQILSMSKRIVNEVIDVCNDLEIVVLYTDTDSLHLMLEEGKDMKSLETEYEKRYGRKLMGSELGQFGYELKMPNSEEVYSNRVIILGKKAYFHMLCNEKGETMPYYRMKGVNGYAMLEYPDKLNLYSRLYEGEEITFDLCYGDATSFKYTNGVVTRDEFKKKIKFDGKKGVLN